MRAIGRAIGLAIVRAIGQESSMKNFNLNGVDTMSRQEMVDRRNQLQIEVDRIDNELEMDRIERGDKPPNELWVQSKKASRKFKVRAINTINEELGAIRRKEEAERQRSLEACFMKAAKAELSEDKFYDLMRAAQMATGFTQWKVE